MKKIVFALTLVFCVIISVAKDNKLADRNKNVDSVAKQPLVYLNASNKLAYNKFANEGESNRENTIPDFSNAGYKGGGVVLPKIPVAKTISAINGDNRSHIQSAINEVESMPLDANGFRGAVLLKAGLYEVEGALVIKKSGVVLRGEGQGSKGTIIKATKKDKHNLIELTGSGSGYGELSGTRTKITTAYLGTGTKSFTVASASAYKAGDHIVVNRTPNQFWIDDLAMGQYNWTYQDYEVAYERKIVSVSGNTITIDAPVVDPIQTKYGGGAIYKANITGRISNSGVENLRLTSYYANDTDEKHGWNAVRLSRTENCWVKQVTAEYFGYSCVSLINQSVFNTIEECAMLDPKAQTTGGRKYSFNIGDGSFNLFQRCYTRGGRHDFVTGGRVAGPNVFLDCYAFDTQNDTGPHHRWATGILLDNIYAGQMRVQNRKASGTGHGWAGAQTLFWNCESVKSEIKVESPKGAKNWAIGCIGLQKAGAGEFESWGKHVPIRSLYLAQLKDRLDNAAVNNITIPSQRNKGIYELLKNWAGEGELPVQ